MSRINVFCVKVFSAIMIANVVSASFLTLFSGSWTQLPFVYTCVFMVGLSAQVPKLEGWPWTQNRRERFYVIGLMISLILALSLVRMPYFLEPFFSQVAGPVTGDDLWHVQELLSLTLSKQFPPLYGVFERDYLLFYYSPWMVMATLMTWLPVKFASAKFAYGLGYALYVALIIPIVVGIIQHFSKNSRHFWWLLFLLLGHAGMQSFNVFSFPFASHENWMGHYNIYVQFSAFSTLMLWVVHHVVAVVTLMLAYLLYSDNTHPRMSWQKAIHRTATLGFFLAAALMSSPFVCMGAFPLILWIVYRDRQRALYWLLPSGCVGMLVSAPLLWTYLQKSSDFRFLFNVHTFFEGPVAFLPNLLLSLAVFLILVAMEFIVPVFIWIRLRRVGLSIPLEDRVLLGIALGMILSTFFVGYGIYNNYAMRASILPIFVGLGVLAHYAAQLPKLTGKTKKFALFFVGCMILGSLNEIGSVGKATVEEIHNLRQGDAARQRIFYLNETYKRSEWASTLTVDDQAMLAERIGDTNARNVMLLERPLGFALDYHENDVDLIGPAPAMLWSRLHWRDTPPTQPKL